jgi:hypothetical protein
MTCASHRLRWIADFLGPAGKAVSVIALYSWLTIPRTFIATHSGILAHWPNCSTNVPNVSAALLASTQAT